MERAADCQPTRVWNGTPELFRDPSPVTVLASRNLYMLEDGRCGEWAFELAS